MRSSTQGEGAIGAGGATWEVAATGDYNGDGTDDILWHNTATFQVGQWLMNDGNFTWDPIGLGGAAWDIA